MKTLRFTILLALLSLPAAASADVLPPDGATPAEDAGTDTDTDDGGCSVGVAGSLGSATPLAFAAGLLFVRRRGA